MFHIDIRAQRLPFGKVAAAGIALATSGWLIRVFSSSQSAQLVSACSKSRAGEKNAQKQAQYRADQLVDEQAETSEVEGRQSEVRVAEPSTSESVRNQDSCGKDAPARAQEEKDEYEDRIHLANSGKDLPIRGGIPCQ